MLKKREFLKLWDEAFAAVRKRQYEGKPGDRAIRAMCVGEDHTAGLKYWRKFGDVYRPLTVDEARQRLASWTQEEK